MHATSIVMLALSYWRSVRKRWLNSGFRMMLSFQISFSIVISSAISVQFNYKSEQQDSFCRIQQLTQIAKRLPDPHQGLRSTNSSWGTEVMRAGFKWLCNKCMNMWKMWKWFYGRMVIGFVGQQLITSSWNSIRNMFYNCFILQIEVLII